MRATERWLPVAMGVSVLVFGLALIGAVVAIWQTTSLGERVEVIERVTPERVEVALRACLHDRACRRLLAAAVLAALRAEGSEDEPATRRGARPGSRSPTESSGRVAPRVPPPSQRDERPRARVPGPELTEPLTPLRLTPPGSPSPERPQDPPPASPPHRDEGQPPRGAPAQQPGSPPGQGGPARGKRDQAPGRQRPHPQGKR